jgi:predicted amidohydrolase
MGNSINVSLVQTRLKWREPGPNRNHLEGLIRSAPGSDLYVLPETFTTGFLGETTATDEDMQGETVNWMRNLAADTGAAITGSAVIRDERGRLNRLLFVEPDGTIQVYDKRHLFAFAGEDQRYVAGEQRVVMDFAGWRICPQICYDLRFPVWCRNRGDYDLLLFVANWPARRVDAWDALLKARAIENQCYVVAVNRVGEDGNGIRYPGHSAIYGPLGETVIPPGEDEGITAQNLDLEVVTGIRQKLPFAREADPFRLTS